MSSALIKPDDIEQSVSVAKLGDIFVKSGFFKDTRDQYQAVVKILYGRELGFSPVVSMMGVHIIDGKPSLSANLMGTLVKRSSRYNYRVTESTATRCEIQFFENGEESGVSIFTIDDANQAGVATKQNWTRYPKAMLFARALSAGVKLHCPDVSACPLYVPEEMGAVVNEDGEVVELPKSARPVETTTADIEIGGHGNNAKAQPTLEKGAPQAPDAAEYIGVNQQKNFHKECRAAVKPERSLDADNLTYQWLKDNEYVDAEGRPTAAKITAGGWIATRNKAVEWLKTQ